MEVRILKSFIAGMEAAINYKDGLAQMVISMFGYEYLKKHIITFKGVTKTGHIINIPITENMLKSKLDSRI